MTNYIRFAAVVLLMGSLLLIMGCGKKAEKETEEMAAEQSQTQEISDKLLHPDPAELNKPSPATYQVKFETSKGNFIVAVNRDWAPYGADRFYFLVKNGFYDDIRFFRVVAGFMAQFGYHGDPNVSAIWSDMTFPDDPVKASNLRGYVTFAKSNAPNSRSTNIFINYRDNSYLDNMGFAPIGKVVEGMEVVDQLYSDYGDSRSSGGNGPEQSTIKTEGNNYLNRDFPKLDYIKKATIISE